MGFMLLVRQKVLKALLEGKTGDLRQVAWWEHLRKFSNKANVVLFRLGFVYHCTVCEDTEGDGMYVCPNEECSLIYCAMCWADVDQKCLNCVITELNFIPEEEISLAVGMIGY